MHTIDGQTPVIANELAEIAERAKLAATVPDTLNKDDFVWWALAQLEHAERSVRYAEAGHNKLIAGHDREAARLLDVVTRDIKVLGAHLRTKLEGNS